MYKIGQGVQVVKDELDGQTKLITSSLFFEHRQ